MTVRFMILIICIFFGDSTLNLNLDLIQAPIKPHRHLTSRLEALLLIRCLGLSLKGLDTLMLAYNGELLICNSP